MKHILLSLSFFFLMNIFNQTDAQVDSAYLLYKQQFADLIITRSGTMSEAAIALEKFNKNQITSNQSFADFIKKVYPQEKGIGVLLFFFHNDTLKRVFFEPGKVVESSSLAIKKEALITLGEDLNTALQIYEASVDRAPVERGVSITRNQKRIDLDTAIKRLTNLLLPSSFDESYRHLIVIPSLNIGTIPFQLLKPYSDSSYLADRCSITMAPTLVDFVGLRYEALFNLRVDDFDPTRSYKTFDRMIADGNIAPADSLFMTLSNALFVCNPAYPENGVYAFPDLPGAEKEISSAVGYSDSYTLLKGKDATKDSVLKHLNGKDIAYFATHGISSKTNTDDNTFLVLSGKDPYLTSLEIKDLRFNRDFKMPELVILSACQTGLGQYMEAGTMGSLARAFLLAGSNHVIMSLWNVDDDATAFLMSRFIYHLKMRHPFTPSEPLRLAMVETKEKFKKPLLWASFSLFGVNY